MRRSFATLATLAVALTLPLGIAATASAAAPARTAAAVSAFAPDVSANVCRFYGGRPDYRLHICRGGLYDREPLD